MTRCLRCGHRTHDSRRVLELRDFTDATASHYEGRLCPQCWETVLGDILGFDVGKKDPLTGMATTGGRQP